MPTDATDASAALRAAKEAIKAAWGPVRLQLARCGDPNADPVDVGSNDTQLDEALDLLAQHSTFPAAPLLKAKTWLSDPPPIFNIGAVRDWVADPMVRDAAKRTARAHIAGIEPDPSDESLLVGKYSEYTLEHPHAAADAIRQLLSFLALSIKRFLTPADATILAQSRDQTQAIRSDISDVVGKIDDLRVQINAQQTIQATADCLPRAYADKQLNADLDRALRRRCFSASRLTPGEMVEGPGAESRAPCHIVHSGS
jgi:hypothetical protein